MSELCLIEIIERLSKIRIYNSCNVFKGVMIKDQEACYKLVKEARDVIEKLNKIEELENEQ